jgi:hypothetical protein
MTAIATSPTKVGALVKKEFWSEVNYCRNAVTAEVSNAAVIGLVMYVDGDDGDVNKPLTQTVAAAFGATPRVLSILVDETVAERAADAAADVANVAVIVKGPIVLSKGPIVTSGADPVVGALAAMYTVLAAQGIDFSENNTLMTTSRL